MPIQIRTNYNNGWLCKISGDPSSMYVSSQPIATNLHVGATWYTDNDSSNLLSMVLENQSFPELTSYCPPPPLYIDTRVINFRLALFMCISKTIEKHSVVLPVFCAVQIWTSNIKTPPKIPHSKTILARYLGKCDLSYHTHRLGYWYTV